MLTRFEVGGSPAAWDFRSRSRMLSPAVSGSRITCKIRAFGKISSHAGANNVVRGSFQPHGAPSFNLNRRHIHLGLFRYSKISPKRAPTFEDRYFTQSRRPSVVCR